MAISPPTPASTPGTRCPEARPAAIGTAIASTAWPIWTHGTGPLLGWATWVSHSGTRGGWRALTVAIWRFLRIAVHGGAALSRHPDPLTTTMALSCPFLIPAGGQFDYQLAGVGLGALHLGDP